MILRMPEYCADFRCTADKCSDSCCIGWEIDIDSETARRYDETGGEFGERLRKNITSGEVRSFILDKQERCPFLNKSNLCEIIINLGEESLCQICSDHPRYFEWFDGIKEGGIGLCCEEAARIILSQSKPMTCAAYEILDETCDEYDAELYHFLFAAREKILEHIQDASIPLKNRLGSILRFAEELQLCVDNACYELAEITAEQSEFVPDLKAILEFMLTIEPIDENWIPYIRDCISNFSGTSKALAEFEEAAPETEVYLQNIAVYFVWRYFLKGVFDGELLSRIRVMAVSTELLRYMFCCKWCGNRSVLLADCVEIAKNYSKEIEYCEENMAALADFLC